MSPNIARKSEGVGSGSAYEIKQCFGYHRGAFLCYFEVFFFFALLFSSFSTSRGHRCRSARLQPSHCSSIFHRALLWPFLIQSDPPSQKRPFSTGFFFDWNLLVLLLIVSQIDLIVFVLFLEAVGVRVYCCTGVEIGWQLYASRAFSASNGSTNPRPSKSVAMGLAESR